MLSFHVKFMQRGRRTDRWTTVKQYAPQSFDTGAYKVIDLSKFKINWIQILRLGVDLAKIKNIMGKGENASY